MVIHNRLNTLYLYRKELVKKRDRHVRLYKAKYKENEEKLENDIEEKDKNALITKVNKEIQITKNNICLEFGKSTGIRQLNRNYLYRKDKRTKKEIINKKNIISVFDSTLTRILKISENTLSDELIIVQTYFFDVIEDIILDGFMLGDESYICLTASAGQIRTKKTVFIKESSLNRIYNTLTCGLSIETINKHDGCNINKYLAYLALSNSATDEWIDFNIDKTIVIEDMETLVEGVVDLIDDVEYKISRKTMQIPIPHTDGIGMILPNKSKKNFMTRLPWVKGLLASWSFDKFIREKTKETGEYCGIIEDIYGIKHDILKEGIEVIFTRSQFKMYKYFDSWEQYQENFKRYNCQAGKCNVEEDEFSSAKLNYQMLQTLTKMEDKELKKISKLTVENINKIGKDRNTMLKVLGVVKSNTNKNYIQQALEIYPELLNDTYSKEILKQTKKSLVKEGRAGKLDLGNTGTYTFIIPDLYAFCEWTFLGDKNPNGLLKDKEVSCKLFKDEPKLDCLRSPHLYREHAIRNNVIDDEKKRWFITNGLYTSCHDIISKILMFDVDGDKSLVCSHPTLIEVAERNMEGVVPLYYNMRKAKPEKITRQSIFEGLKSAYTGGNIGLYSNDISKIWNSDDIGLDIIKLLCMENNFVIDYAKTLYKPKRPKDKQQLITSYTKSKVPHFFVYAKDKEVKKVDVINKSVVNRLEKIIPNPNINFKAINLGNFDYTTLMKNKEVDINNEIRDSIIKKYTELDLKKHFMINKTNDEELNNIMYVYEDIKKKLLEINNDYYYIADILIKYLYEEKKSNFKTTLWECFGDVIVENLKENVDNNFIQCEKCGKRIKITSNRKKFCEECWKEEEKKLWRENKRKHRNRKNVQV